MEKKYWLLSGVIVFLFLAIGSWRSDAKEKAKAKNESFPVQKTEAQWKKDLSAQAFYVLRQHGTEPSGSSPLDKVKQEGVFSCAGCKQALFATAQKFNSGTGWPSFYAPISAKAVGTSTDYKMVVARTEVHCSNCGGHLGHVFDDGPKPTGLRYCMNGVAMKFQAKKKTK